MALVRRIGFTRFSRFGANLGRLHAMGATHTEALDGTDELKITCSDDVNKGDYIVWIDNQGVPHEHIVDDVDREHGEDGTIETTFTGVNSIAELWDDWTDDKRPSGQVATALQSVLNGTRWTVGTCDVTTSASVVLYHQSARESISDILDAWGGELETTIATNGSEVTGRSVGVRRLRGNQQSPKRFTWTKDIKTIKRKVSSDNPKTRVYGYGKGVETESGGYGRRLTFASINGGKSYVEDAAATRIWGHPGADGAILPACTSYVNEQCEDAAQLLAESNAYLAEVSEPTVSYEASVIDLYAFGREWEGVGIGDRVAIIDKGFSESGVRLAGRVSKLERDLLTGDAVVTFGNLQDSMADMWQSVSQTLRTHSRTAATYDAVASASSGWLTRLQDALNDQFNATGTYKVETFELGTIYSNVPLNPQTGLPTKSVADMWAVNISGRGIRLASSLTSSGQWDWQTFITGASVTADLINAGTMKADRIRAGLLTDETGTNYWDLTTGEFKLATNAKVGDVDMAHTVYSADVEYGNSASATEKPTEWATDAHWQQGKYLWTRVKMRLLDGTLIYSAARLVSNGQGIGIASVEDQYYLSTSKTSPSGGYWYSQQPTWVKGCSYWTRSKITWSDGSTTFTNPVLASALTSGNQSTNDLDDTLNQREVFNRLTNNGKTQGVYLSNGLLYINATYISTGIISDKLGRNTWNLSTGALTTNYMTANNINANGTMTSGTTTGYMAKLTGGSMRFYYNDNPTIEVVSIPSYTGGSKGGYIQACDGATYLGLRAPHLYTATNTSSAGTTGSTGDHQFTLITKIDDLGEGRIQWWTGTRNIDFINGICTVCNL